jgi:hypothetical protein
MFPALRKAFLAFLLIDLALAVLVVVLEAVSPSPWLLIRIRGGLFTHFATDVSQLDAPVPELTKRGFLVDPPELIAGWRDKLKAMPQYAELLERVENSTSSIERARAIVLGFSQYGGPFYGPKANLDEKLSTISEPRGVCSDHTEVFEALASVAGLAAMETLTGGHNTAAFYAPELRKWIWIDPEYAVMARDPAGNYMSPFELRNAYLRG